MPYGAPFYFKQLYLIQQYKLIFIPSGFPSCDTTTRGLVKVFLLCIIAKIISTLREVQASSGGMHCKWKKQCMRSERVTHCQLHSCPIISFILYSLPKKEDNLQTTPYNVLTKVILSCASGHNLCLH